MDKNLKKKIFFSIFCSLLLTIGISYSFFNYTKMSGLNEIVNGQIYMHYTTDRVLSLENAFPSEDRDTNQYIAFTIDGKNTYNLEDIWYAIDVLYGDIPEGLSEENRIRDDLLRFTLTDTVDDNEQIIFQNRSYTSINNRRIWVETIPRNTIDEIVHHYKLYIWISNDVTIGNMESDYSISEWNNIFASIRLRVIGDFEEKYITNVNDLDVVIKAKNKQETTSCKTYIEEDGVFYLSGNNECVDFNYVWYSGKLWRIVSIDASGKIKMVTEDNMTSIAFNEEDNRSYYSNNIFSYPYKWLNEYFVNSLYNYNYVLSNTNSWNYSSIDSNDISTKLSNVNTVTSYVGLLNSYDYYMSYKNVDFSQNSYLNNGYSFWLANSNNNGVFYVYYYGDINVGNPNFVMGIRPAVNIKASTIIQGDGTINNPYTFSMDKNVNQNDYINTRLNGEYIRLDDNDLYRIVSVNSGVTKIVKDSYVGNNVMKAYTLSSGANSYGTGINNNTWDYYLNNDWKNSFLTNNGNILVRDNYYLGKNDSSLDYQKSICNDNNSLLTCERQTSLNTYVGLLYYGEMFATNYGNQDMYLLTKYNNSRVWKINKYGLGTWVMANEEYAVRPTVSLKGNVVIKAGNGTKNNPFTIQKDNSTLENANAMTAFVGVVLDNISSIKKIVFKDMNQEIINNRYNNTDESLRVDLTSNNEGKVIGLLVPNENYNNMYTLEVLSDGITYFTHNSMFYNFTNVEEIELGNASIGRLTTLKSMFENCSSLQSIDISSFNTENIVSMQNLFLGDTNLTSIIFGDIDTDSVTNFVGMFKNCSSLTSINLEKFVTTSATSMEAMFYGCSSLITIDLSLFVSHNIENMKSMFFGCTNLQSINMGDFESANLNNLSHLFFNCSSLKVLDLSSFNTSSVTSFHNIFQGCSTLKRIFVSPVKWSTASIESDTDVFFNGCTSLKGWDNYLYTWPKYTVEYAKIGTANVEGFLTDISDYNKYESEFVS